MSAPGTVEAGQEATIAAVVRNNGPNGSSGSRVDFGLDASMTYRRSSTGHTCERVGDVVRCTVGGIGNGASASVGIVVMPATAGSRTTTATVTGNEQDPNGGNNAGSVTWNVIAADVVLTLGASVNPVPAGGLTRIDARVANNAPPGGAPARDVRVVFDPLALGLVYTHHAVTDQNYNPRPGAACALDASRVFSCSLGTMPPGELAIVQLQVRVHVKGPISVAAGAEAPFDANPADNRPPPHTLTVNPAACAPRPPVTISAANNGDGRLRVTVSAGTGGEPNNRLEALRFGAASNAIVEIGDQTYVGGNVVHSVYDGPTTLTFFVRRASAGAASHLPFEVIDHCAAPWPTFVGGGPSAF